MKKILIGLASVLLTVSANAQGLVTFNNIGNAIQSVNGGALGTGFNVELLVGGNVLASTPIVGGGTFLGADPVDLLTADPVDVTIRAYPDSFADYATAAGTPGAEILAGVTFLTQGGNSQAAPPEVPSALGFPGGTTSVVAIPEPSTIALGILGLGALALRRRRNA